MINQNLNNFFYIVLLVPFFAISGPFLTDLIVSLSVLVFLFYIIKNKSFIYFDNNFTKLFFIFCCYCIFCSIIAENTLFSLKSSFFYFRIGIFSLLIFHLINYKKNFQLYFYYSLLICFLLLILDGYFQYFTGKNVLGLEMLKNNSRISSFFGDKLILGSYLSRMFPLLFALFLIKEKKKYEIYMMGLVFILIDVLIFISGERTAFIMLNVSSIFIIALIYKYQKFRLITFLIGFALILLITFNNSSIKNRMILSPINTMGLLTADDKKHIFTPSHDSLYRTAYNIFLDKPIFGHGPKMFRKLCNNPKYQVGIYPCSTHPHNFYIQLLAETGLIGFSFLIYCFFYIIFCSFMQIKSIILYKKKRYFSDYQICLLAGLLITVWPFSPNGNFFNNWLVIIYSLPVGFYLQSIYTKKKLL